MQRHWALLWDGNAFPDPLSISANRGRDLYLFSALLYLPFTSLTRYARDRWIHSLKPSARCGRTCRRHLRCYTSAPPSAGNLLGAFSDATPPAPQDKCRCRQACLANRTHATIELTPQIPALIFTSAQDFAGSRARSIGFVRGCGRVYEQQRECRILSGLAHVPPEPGQDRRDR
jgi:hypothetical protein